MLRLQSDADSQYKTTVGANEVAAVEAEGAEARVGRAIRPTDALSLAVVVVLGQRGRHQNHTPDGSPSVPLAHFMAPPLAR